jgi:predicted extracellular nuclease
VVSFNVLNYFQQLDDGTAKCGPPTNLQECRGADEGPIDSLGRTESDRQEAKLIPALLGVDADIYGLIELENDFGNGGITSAARLAELMDQANATDAVTACSDYVAVEPGVYVGTDAIAVGLIYCAHRVELTPGTSIEILDDSDLPGLGLGDWAPLFNGEATNRAALAASFRELATGERLTVSVNHFKSKGDSGIAATVCNPDPTVDPNCDQGDGAGYWNLRRTQAATALSAWLATDPTGAGDPDALVLGDLNAYAKEDPIAALEGAGYENLIARGAPGAYSYLFDAQLGYLDYALANATLAPQVTGVAEWHINADEPDALDYDISFNREQWFFEDAFRTSDHDPVVIGIDLRSPPIPGDLNGDLRVDVRDLRILLRALPSREGGVRWNPAADLNRDGIVSNRDYRIWLRYWRDFNG